MIKKILKLSAINTLSAGLNFLSTILIVKSFGLAILGEFTVFNATISILLLAYIILPPNYSIFKLQDDTSYLEYFKFNYIFISLLLIPLVWLIGIFNFMEINSILIFFYIIFLALQNYFDTFFQAHNQLKNYFLALFIVAFLRFMALLYIFSTDDYSFTLTLLIEIYLASLILVMLALVFFNRKTLLKKRIITIRDYTNYIKNHISTLRSYYFGTIIKRFKDNSFVLLFSMILSSELIGLYTLFVKVGTVVLGQVRVFEAFLMNRLNLAQMNSFKKIPSIVAVSVQLVLIGVGLLYLKINTGSYYLLSLLLYSFVTYPYLTIILSRSKLLSKYNNSAINQSYLLYIFLISISFIIASMMNIESLNYILVTTLLGELVISQLLELKLSKK